MGLIDRWLDRRERNRPPKRGVHTPNVVVNLDFDSEQLRAALKRLAKASKKMTQSTGPK